jgi:hypothetical protein
LYWLSQGAASGDCQAARQSGILDKFTKGRHEELIEYIARSIINSPDDVVVTEGK